MKRIDLAAALTMLALSALVLAATSGHPYWAEFAPGPAFAPVWAAVSGIALSVALLVTTLRRTNAEQADLPDRPAIFRVVATLAGLWFVVAATPLLGLLPAATLLVAFLLLVVARRPLAQSLVATAATMGLVWGVFSAWLNIALPTGLFGI